MVYVGIDGNMHGKTCTPICCLCAQINEQEKKNLILFRIFYMLYRLEALSKNRMAPNKIGKSHIQIACIHARWVCISYIIGECIRNEVAVFKWDWCVMQSHNCSLTRHVVFVYYMCANTHAHMAIDALIWLKSKRMQCQWIRSLLLISLDARYYAFFNESVCFHCDLCKSHFE